MLRVRLRQKMLTDDFPGRLKSPQQRHKPSTGNGDIAFFMLHCAI